MSFYLRNKTHRLQSVWLKIIPVLCAQFRQIHWPFFSISIHRRKISSILMRRGEKMKRRKAKISIYAQAQYPENLFKHSRSTRHEFNWIKIVLIFIFCLLNLIALVTRQWKSFLYGPDFPSNENPSDKKHSTCSAVRECKITQMRKEEASGNEIVHNSKTNNFFINLILFHFIH